MKPLLFVAAATVIVILTFPALVLGKHGKAGQKDSVTKHARRPTVPAKSFTLPHTSSTLPRSKAVGGSALSKGRATFPAGGTALPVSPQTKAAEDVLFAESRREEAQARALYASGDLAGAEQASLRSLAAAPIIGGVKQQVPFVPRLLGRIYLAEGQNQKALEWLRSAYPNTADSGIDLDVALAYCRLGNYEQARRFYSDQAILQYHVAGKDADAQDLPGADSPQSLESSILLARGIDAFFEARKNDALADFAAAAILVPQNPLIHYYSGMALLHLGRYAEAAPHFQSAASFGHGPLAKVSSEQFLSTRSSAQMQAQQAQANH